MNKEQAEAKYERIMEAVYLAVDSEQPSGGDEPYSEETEKRLNFVHILVRESLGLPTEEF